MSLKIILKIVLKKLATHLQRTNELNQPGQTPANLRSRCIIFCRRYYHDYHFVIDSAKNVSINNVMSHYHHCHGPHWYLTRWGRMTHVGVSKLNIADSDNGLSPDRRQAIILTNAGILLIWRLGINFSEMFIKIHTFLFEKMHLKMTSAKWRPIYLGLSVSSLHCDRLHPYQCFMMVAINDSLVLLWWLVLNINLPVPQQSSLFFYDVIFLPLFRERVNQRWVFWIELSTPNPVKHATNTACAASVGTLFNWVIYIYIYIYAYIYKYSYICSSWQKYPYIYIYIVVSGSGLSFVRRQSTSLPGTN